MPATALIKFTQGISGGIPGRALVGNAGSSVLIQNGNDIGIGSWQLDLTYTPPGSSIPIAAPFAFSDSAAPVSAVFTPDVRGCYRFALKVWNFPNRIGNLADIDIRNFVVLTTTGLVIPSYQKDPDSLPTLASGLPGAKPNELNINGHEFGWEGLTGDGLLADSIDRIEFLTANLIPPTALVNVTPFTVLQTQNILMIDTSVPRTLSLYNPANGGWFIAKDKTGTSWQNNITLHPFANESIETGAPGANVSIGSPFGTWLIWTDRTNWWIGGVVTI
ncbi:MAG TPA: hypothetical protein VIE65_15335 [Methylobacter sp.]|jgi:hypothetical protein